MTVYDETEARKRFRLAEATTTSGLLIYKTVNAENGNTIYIYKDNMGKAFAELEFPHCYEPVITAQGKVKFQPDGILKILDETATPTSSMLQSMVKNVMSITEIVTYEGDYSGELKYRIDHAQRLMRPEALN